MDKHKGSGVDEEAESFGQTGAQLNEGRDSVEESELLGDVMEALVEVKKSVPALVKYLKKKEDISRLSDRVLERAGDIFESEVKNEKGEVDAKKIEDLSRLIQLLDRLSKKISESVDMYTAMSRYAGVFEKITEIFNNWGPNVQTFTYMAEGLPSALHTTLDQKENGTSDIKRAINEYFRGIKKAFSHEKIAEYVKVIEKKKLSDQAAYDAKEMSDILGLTNAEERRLKSVFFEINEHNRARGVDQKKEMSYRHYYMMLHKIAVFCRENGVLAPGFAVADVMVEFMRKGTPEMKKFIGVRSTSTKPGMPVAKRPETPNTIVSSTKKVTEISAASGETQAWGTPGELVEQIADRGGLVLSVSPNKPTTEPMGSQTDTIDWFTGTSEGKAMAAENTAVEAAYDGEDITIHDVGEITGAGIIPEDTVTEAEPVIEGVVAEDTVTEAEPVIGGVVAEDTVTEFDPVAEVVVAEDMVTVDGEEPAVGAIEEDSSQDVLAEDTVTEFDQVAEGVVAEDMVTVDGEEPAHAYTESIEATATIEAVEEVADAETPHEPGEEDIEIHEVVEVTPVEEPATATIEAVEEVADAETPHEPGDEDIEIHEVVEVTPVEEPASVEPAASKGSVVVEVNSGAVESVATDSEVISRRADRRKASVIFDRGSIDGAVDPESSTRIMKAPVLSGTMESAMAEMFAAAEDPVIAPAVSQPVAIKTEAPVAEKAAFEAVTSQRPPVEIRTDVPLIMTREISTLERIKDRVYEYRNAVLAATLVVLGGTAVYLATRDSQPNEGKDKITLAQKATLLKPTEMPKSQPKAVEVQLQAKVQEAQVEESKDVQNGELDVATEAAVDIAVETFEPTPLPKEELAGVKMGVTLANCDNEGKDCDLYLPKTTYMPQVEHAAPIRVAGKTREGVVLALGGAKMPERYMFMKTTEQCGALCTEIETGKGYMKGAIELVRFDERIHVEKK